MSKFRNKLIIGFALLFMITSIAPLNQASAWTWENGEMVLEPGEERLILKPGGSVYIPVMYHFFVEGPHKTITKALKTGKVFEDYVDIGRDQFVEYANWDGEITGNFTISIINTSNESIRITGELGDYKLNSSSNLSVPAEEYFPEYSAYQNKVSVDYEVKNKSGYSASTVGFYYNDATLLNRQVPLVFITKVNKEGWERYTQENLIGPHERIIEKGNFVYIWSLPGEHPYEPYGRHHKEAQEWMDIYNKIMISLEKLEKGTLWDISGHRHQEAIMALVNKGVISGFNNGEFRPNSEIKRGDAAVIVARAKGLLDGNIPKVGLTDLGLVNKTTQEAIGKLVEAGIISGYGDRTFKPNNPITRGEMSKILVLAYDLQPGDGKTRFADVKPTQALAPYVDAIADAGITIGYGNGKFGYGDNIKRGDFAKFIYLSEQL